MNTGFTVSPRPARAGGCVFALQARVHESVLGCAAGRAKEGVGDLTRLGPPGAGLRRAARGQSIEGI